MISRDTVQSGHVDSCTPAPFMQATQVVLQHLDVVTGAPNRSFSKSCCRTVLYPEIACFLQAVPYFILPLQDSSY